MRQTPAVLIVTAHPDDETFGCGGTTALLSDRGVPVHVLLATSGHAGEITDPELDTPLNQAHLHRVREFESLAAGAEVGVASIEFLGHHDGHLAEVGDEPLALQMAGTMRRLQAAVVITFGPDGIYGHPDHLAVHRAARRAWDLAADPDVEIDGLPPHPAARLFYQAMTDELAAQRNAQRGPVQLGDGEYPFVGYPVEEMTTRVDATAVVERKLAALARHRTQTASRFDQIAEMMRSGPLFENFRLAERRVPDAAGLDGDLLAGLL